MQADFVIVGSGSAGSALAVAPVRGRQAHRHGAGISAAATVAPFIQMPAALAWPMSMKMYNWGYLSEPEPNLNNRRITAPRGKVIGGSSSINGMVYVRGSAEDFDSWDESGATGWSYADVLPYFKRQESSKGGQEGWRGTDGPLHVQRGPAKNPLVRCLRRGGSKQAGFETTEDYNGEKQEGFGLMEQTIHKRSPLVCRLGLSPPGDEAPNVELVRCFARRVVIENGRAVGVEIERGGSIEMVKANREVDHLRLVVQFAETADAVRHRSGRPSQGDGHRGEGRSPRRRRQPDGPYGILLSSRSPPSRSRSIPGSLVLAGRCRCPVAVRQVRPRHVQPVRSPAPSCARRRVSGSRISSSISCRWRFPMMARRQPRATASRSMSATITRSRAAR